MSHPRIEIESVAPDAVGVMSRLDVYVGGLGVEPGLMELIRYRASQINGCALCLEMHSRDARAGGESEQRLFVLSAWRETPYFTPRERAALSWTEAVTRVSDGNVPDSVYA